MSLDKPFIREEEITLIPGNELALPKKKRKRGRPIGGKSHPVLRKFWREAKRRYRAKKKAKKK